MNILFVALLFFLQILTFFSFGLLFFKFTEIQHQLH